MCITWGAFWESELGDNRGDHSDEAEDLHGESAVLSDKVLDKVTDLSKVAAHSDLCDHVVGEADKGAAKQNEKKRLELINYYY